MPIPAPALCSHRFPPSTPARHRGPAPFLQPGPPLSAPHAGLKGRDRAGLVCQMVETGEWDFLLPSSPKTKLWQWHLLLLGRASSGAVAAAHVLVLALAATSGVTKSFTSRSGDWHGQGAVCQLLNLNVKGPLMSRAISGSYSKHGLSLRINSKWFFSV